MQDSPSSSIWEMVSRSPSLLPDPNKFSHSLYIEDLTMWSFHMKYMKQAFGEFYKFHMK